jgi:hypothetical protein
MPGGRRHRVRLQAEGEISVRDPADDELRRRRRQRRREERASKKDLRRWINKSPWVVGIFAALSVAMVIFMVWRTSPPSSSPGKAFYSIDDGLTYFSDSPERLPPFDYDGKVAVRAHVFKCNDGKKFVGYLERYTEPAKAILARHYGGGGSASMTTDELKVLATGREFKRPGPGGWMKLSPREMAGMVDFVLRQKMGVKCANGSHPEPVID